MEYDYTKDNLLLFILDDQKFSKQYREPAEQRLVKMQQNDQYDHAFARKFYRKIVDKATEMMPKRDWQTFDGLPSPKTVFPVAVRDEVAEELVRSFEGAHMGREIISKVVQRYAQEVLDQETHIVREIYQWINDNTALEQQRRYMEDNLLAKIRQGVYDHEKAPKLWLSLVDSGVKAFVSAFDNADTDMQDVLTKSDREKLAKHYADVFANEYDLVILKAKKDSLPKATIPSATLKQFGELKVMLDGGTVVSTRERLAAIRDVLKTELEHYSEDVVSEQDLLIKNLLW